MNKVYDITEAQKRVLKTMLNLDCKVTVRRGYGGMSLVRFLGHKDVIAPSAGIIHALCRQGLLLPNVERYRSTIYHLTSKGREIAR